MVGPFVHDTPASRVIFGNGSIAQVSTEVERLGCRRVLLVSGRSEAAFAARIAAQLGDRLVGDFTDVVMHVPVETARRAASTARDLDADVVLALGGGSSTGTAKAIALETRLPVVAVPTTYAGSEMTTIWGLTENGRKITGRDRVVLPRTVIYDPELTLTLPVSLSAASGMNALAHLIEGLYDRLVSPVLAAQAGEGIRALANALPRVVSNPADLDARGDALYGAWLAGWILGTCGMGVHHKICHTLGGTYNLAHAPTHSAVIAYATQYNLGAAPEAMDCIVRAFAAAGRSAPDAATAVWELARDIGAPTSLASVGLAESSLDEAATIVVAGMPENPRPVNLQGVRSLLGAAYEGARPHGHLA
jgi:alcohol dehydrogenase class IV